MGGRTAAHDDAQGQMVGPYRLRQWLAHGGMAELYLSYRPDTSAKQVVVLKRILPQYTQDENFARMFEREVQLASSLRHDNLVRVFDAGQGGPRDCYLTMEYIHGMDLAKVLRELRRRKTRMDIGDAVFIAMGMCAGLHHAHEHLDDDGNLLEIVHRDVSPSNVLLSYDGAVKVTDFGVAKALSLSSFTQAGTRKGKLSYMSPEQARAEPFDRRTDIFAIGVVLFEMTTGQRMFKGDNELAIIHSMLFSEAPRPSEIIKGYPAPLEQIVMKAVAPKAEDRYGTATDLRRALEGFVRHRGGLPPSRKSLAALLASISPAPPHPGDDPTFFDAEAPASIVSRDDETRVENPGSAPGSDGGDEPATQWSSSSPVDPTPAPGYPPSAPAVVVPLPATPSLPMAIPIPPASGPGSAITPGGHPAWTPGPAAVRQASRDKSRTAVWVVGGAALVALAVVGGGLAASWLTDSDATQASDPAEPATPTKPATAPPQPATVPPQPAVVVDEPAPAAVGVDEGGEDGVVIEPPPEPEATDAPEPTPEPSAAPEPAPHKPRPGKKRRSGKSKPAAEAPSPSDAGKPPPPPPPKSKKRAPTDTLLPILDG